MSSFNNVFQIAKDMNGPPGLVHPLLVENYAWIDKRLREMYHSYALTASNCDEYEVAGLLSENYAWVDKSLADKYKISDEDFLPCPLPLWLMPRNGREQTSVESYISHKRKRSESDISDYEAEAGRVIKRMRCQTPIPTCKYYSLLSNPFCNLDCERYNFIAEANAEEEYEADSVSSLDLESPRDDNYSGFMNRFNPLTTVIPYDDEWEQRFANYPTPSNTINASSYDVHVVTEDEESSVYYDTDYDCDGYDSP